jgi:ribA/ribD-fused uncharacterized protein
MPIRIDSFRGDFAFLSNFLESPIEFEGDVYPTVEHAFQAAKTCDPEERDKVRVAKTPSSAKKIGRRVKLRSDWEAVKVGIMLDLLRIKFSDPALRQQLLGTGDAELVEGNTWNDTFWGVSSKTGKGKNTLGKLLMQVRDECGG